VVALDEALDSPFEIDHLTPEQAALDQEALDVLRGRLALLPELQQQVLRLRFADGLRTREIAERLKKSDGAIRSLLLRSLNLLRHLYTHEEGQTHE
jgi:RNA polymerase sigma-70 factor (ECF subfamily)